MLITPSLRCRAAWRVWRRALPLALLVAVVGLAACSPVETWRNLTGASKNDPNPETTPNTKNLEAGNEAPYPNLATVPPPPTGGLTEDQLEKLTKSLIADRTHAQYSSEQLRAGFAAQTPPPPPPGPQEASKPGAAAPPSGQAKAAAAATTSPPGNAAASPTGAPPGNAATGPAEASSPEEVAVAPAGAAAKPGRQAGKLPTGRRQAGEPPLPGPMESSLTMPEMETMPPPEAVEPAPPQPHLPAPKTSPAPASMLASLPPPSAEEKAPPPAPAIGPPPAPPKAAKSAKPAPNGPVRLASVMFPTQSATIPDVEQQQLAAIVPFFKTHPGIIRVIGYAGDTGGGALEQLNSFSAALDRAQAVAAALTKAGIPAAKIKVEAAPSSAALGPPRAEILLVPSG
jgi:outer membrane protein OmpA-like peptidoglycan-associated protein